MSAEQQEGAEPVTCEEVVPEPVAPTPEEAEEAKKKAQEIFDYYDHDKSGYIDAKEVENVIRKWIEAGTIGKLTEEEIKSDTDEFMQGQDENADSKVSFDEIYNAVVRGDAAPVPQKLTPEQVEEFKEYVQKSFDEYDLDKSGYIDATDIENIFRKCNNEENNYIAFTEEEIKTYAAEFIKEGDLNADAEISFDELFKFLLRSCGLLEV